MTPPGRDFDATLGTEFLEQGDGFSRGRIAVHDGLCQPLGMVHGGVMAALAETLASRATYAAVAGEGMIAVGLSSQASFLRPISAGHVNATARARHRGRTTWVWEVDVTDDEGRLCALVRMTIAVRPRSGRRTA